MRRVICLNDTFTPIDNETVTLFRDHTTHTTGLWHRSDCVAMDMEISATGSVHTWQCFLRCAVSYIQSGMEFPGDSPFVLQEPADIFGLNMVSQQRHAWDRGSRMLFTDWAGQSESEQPFSAAFQSSCPRERSGYEFGLLFTRSHSVAWQPQGRQMPVKAPSCTDTGWGGGGQPGVLTLSVVTAVNGHYTCYTCSCPLFLSA